MGAVHGMREPRERQVLGSISLWGKRVAKPPVTVLPDSLCRARMSVHTHPAFPCPHHSCQRRRALWREC